MPYFWQAPEATEPSSWRLIFRGRSCISCRVLKKELVVDPTDENGLSSAYPQRTLISTLPGSPEPTISTSILQGDSYGTANLEPVPNIGNASTHGAGNEACSILQVCVGEGGDKISAGPIDSGRKQCSVEDTLGQNEGGVACDRGKRACVGTNQPVPREEVPSLSEEDTDDGVQAEEEHVKERGKSSGAARRLWSSLTSAFRKPTTRQRGRARRLGVSSQQRRKPRRKATGKCPKRGSNAAAVRASRRTSWGVVRPVRRLIWGRGSPSREKLREIPTAGTGTVLSSGVPDRAGVLRADSAAKRCARPTLQGPSDGADGVAPATLPRTFLGRLFARRAKPSPGAVDARRERPAEAPGHSLRRLITQRWGSVRGTGKPSREEREENLGLVGADDKEAADEMSTHQTKLSNALPRWWSAAGGEAQVEAGRTTFAPLYGREGISRPRSGHDDCVRGLDLASLLRAILGDGPYPSLPKALVTSKAICKAKERKFLWKKMREIQGKGVGILDFYKLGSVLGQGSFAEVRIGYHKLTGSRVAIKTFFGQQQDDDELYEDIFREVKILNTLNHPRVLRLLEVVESPEGLHLVTEYLGGGTLCEYIEDKGYLSHYEARRIFGQLVEGVDYIHRYGVVHRDIKPENIVLDGMQPANVKLVDFGIGREVTPERIHEFSGTPEYYPPELVQGIPHYGEPVDVWCLGITLFVMLCGRLPFLGSDWEALSSKIMSGSFRISRRVSRNAASLIREILVKDPTRRMEVYLILKHPWMTEDLVQPLPVREHGRSFPSFGMSRVVSRSTREILNMSVRRRELSPEDNVCISTLRLMETCGADTEELLCQIMRHQRSCLTTTFYLLQQQLEADLLDDWSELDESSGDSVEPEPRGNTDGDRPVWGNGHDATGISSN